MLSTPQHWCCSASPSARARWDTFTLGRRRSLLSYITSAKTEPTRIKRAVDLAARISTRTLYGDLPAKRRPQP